MNSNRIPYVILGAIALGSVLPWASAFGVNVSGLKGDGALTLALAVAAAGLYRLRWPSLSPRVHEIAQTAIAMLVVLIAGYHLLLQAFPGVGIYVTLLGGLAWGIYVLRARQARVGV